MHSRRTVRTVLNSRSHVLHSLLLVLLLEGWLQSPQVGVGLPSVQPEQQQPIFSFPYRKLHSGMKTYGCELCGKRFLDSLRLRMHLLAHSGRRGCPDWPLLARATTFFLPLPLLRAWMPHCQLESWLTLSLGCSLQIHGAGSPS